jgi:hypothetical protein
MATFRVGVGSFNIKDGAVGFGTDTDGLGNLRVKGVTKTTGSIVSGASTLTRYSGFAADNINQLENITLTSEVGTIGDIVVGVGTSVIISSGSTVTVGTVESVSIGTHFSPPTGGIEERGQDFVEGMMRFNTDLNTMEFYNGNEWRQFTYTSDIQNSPSSSGRALVAGGENPSNSSSIDFFNISTNGNANHFGNLSTTIGQGASCSSRTRGLFAGGRTPSVINNIEYTTIPSEGNSIDFGDLTLARRRMTGGGLSSSIRGIFASGYVPSPALDVNIIEYVEIATIGNSLDFGDLSVGSWYVSSFSSPTRGVITEGSDLPTMEFITISSKGNSVTFGDSTVTAAGRQSCSNSVRGITAGGYGSATTPGHPLIRFIEFVTIASSGNGQVFGDLTRASAYGQATSSNTRGVFTGGYATVGGGANESNTIDFVIISSAGNAQDFGDLTEGRGGAGACSDCHGGLGGY